MWLNDWTGCGWKWLWPDLKVLSRHLSGGPEEYHKNSQSRESMSPPSFKPGTFQILVRSITSCTNTCSTVSHSNKTTQSKKIINRKMQTLTRHSGRSFISRLWTLLFPVSCWQYSSSLYSVCTTNYPYSILSRYGRGHIPTISLGRWLLFDRNTSSLEMSLTMVYDLQDYLLFFSVF
jgi:hypothetical protein